MSDPFRDQLQEALAPGFVIEREIMGGGMSRVFLATERSLARKVVVKVLPPDLAAGVNTDRFRREIQLAAQLHHPHIVPLLSAGEDDDLLYYTMPYIEGESLRTRLRAGGALPVRDVVRVLHDVVDALAYAHARGIIHRDIKPDNILTLGAHALVTDFGVAKALSASLPLSGATTAGIAIGTPAYMAPEQLAADPSADHRVDIYAVGLLAYELLTGESPFTGASPAATMAAQLTRTPEALDLVRSDVPSALSAVIMRCLEKSPDDRPATADALLAELDAVTTPQGAVLSTAVGRAMLAPGAADAPTLPITQPGAPARPAWMGRPLAIGAAMFIALVAFFVWFASQPLPSHVDERAVVAAIAKRAADSAAAADTSDSDADSADVTLPAPVRRGAPRGTIVLSRADSEAIAKAMEKRRDSAAPRVAAAPNATAVTEPISAESLAAAFSRTLTDSVRQALDRLGRRGGTPLPPDFDRHLDPRLRVYLKRSAGAPTPPLAPIAPIITPPAPGRRRIVIARFENGTPNPELASLGGTISDALRQAVNARNAFDVVGASTTGEAAGTTQSEIALGWTLRADYVVSGVYLMRHDSVVVQAIITDVRRGQVVGAIRGDPSPATDPVRAIPAIADRTIERIERAGRP